MADWEVIEEKPHSDWGASQSHKRMKCLGSLRMERNFPKEQSTYAAEGTKAHGVCETMVRAAQMDNWKPSGTKRAVERAYFFNRHISDVKSASEMMDAAEAYVQYINGILKEHTDSKILLFEIEHAFDMSSLRDDLYGTADCVVIIEWVDAETGELVIELHVVDFKYGAGVVVGAKENSQLAYYALGCFRDLYLLYDITRLTLHIVQPRVKNFDSWSAPIDWLTGEFQDALLEAYDLSQQKDAALSPGPWCADSFCRARGGCPALVKAGIEMSGRTDVLVRHVWESDALALDMITAVRAWCKKREDEIKQKILNKEPTDATAYFKVVNGRSSRAWKNPEAFAKKYPLNTYPIFWHQPELKSVAQIEQAIKDDPVKLVEWDDVSGLVETTRGQPTITRIDDPRTAIDKIDQARNEFMLEDQRQKEEPEDDLLKSLLG